MLKKISLKFKVLFSFAICIMLVGGFSNLYLYNFFTTIISEKSENLDKQHLETIRIQLDSVLSEYISIGDACSISTPIATAISHNGFTSHKEKIDAINAQDAMNSIRAVEGVSSYIQRLLAFGTGDTMVQLPLTAQQGRIDDPHVVRESEIFKKLEESGALSLVGITPSLRSDEYCIAYIAKVTPIHRSHNIGWIYMELDLRLFNEIISPYPAGSFFLLYNGELISPQSMGDLPIEFFQREFESVEKIEYNGKTYRVLSLPLLIEGLSINSNSDVSYLVQNGYPVLYTLMVVLATVAITTIILSVLLSNFLTRPINRLTAHIKKISENDFSFNAEIEKGNDEIAEVGRIVNEMTTSIQHLIDNNEKMYEQRINNEIALLQSQINPHFLYNTLDSIRWLAISSNNMGIAKTMRSLSNLLRNLAKGIDDKISLEEEIALVMDYVETQSLRFMGKFECVSNIPPELLKYKIIKFSLQPLVENSIFHGLEPLEGFGNINISAEEDGDYLIVYVSDNGVGIEPEVLEKLLENTKTTHSSGMSGMGIANVNSRLKLVYGGTCGLSYESKLGEYTKVSVRIPKEVDDV